MLLLTSKSEMVVGKRRPLRREHLTMSMVSILRPSVIRLPSIE